MISHVVVWGLACIIFFGVPFLALWKNGFDFKLGKKEIIVVMSVVIAVCGLALSITGRSNTVYVWDNGNYWRASLEQAQSLRELSAFEGTERLARSINVDEYNTIIPTIASLPLVALGKSYAAFIIVTFIFFVAPSAYVLAKLMEKLLKKKGAFVWFFLIAIFVLPILHPAFTGYFDSALLVPISVLLYLILTTDFQKFRPGLCLWVSALCLMVLIMRRYFAFFLVGLVVAWFAKTATEWIVNRADRKKILWNYIKSMLLIGGGSLIVLILLFSPMLERMLMNYSDMYSAWQHGDFIYNVKRVAGHFGLIPIIISAIGATYLVCKKRGVGVFLIVSIVTSFVLFVQTQSMDTHHEYILLAQMILMECAGFYWLATLLSKMNISRKMAFGLMVGLGGICFISTLFPYNSRFFSNKKLTPIAREDMASLREIVSDVEANPEDKYYVLASSWLFGTDTIRKYNMPRDLKGPSNLLESATADLRDGFSDNLYVANVVLIADPIQLHLSGGQKVVEIPADEILSGRGIGKYYKNVKEYTLQGGVVIKAYRRVGEIDDDAKEQLAEAFDEFYPERRELFWERILNHAE